MNYLKLYENFNDTENDVKTLLSHLTSTLKDCGYRPENYLNGTKWETEFYNGPKHSFTLELSTNRFYTRKSGKNNIDLKIIKSIFNDDEFVEIFTDYLKTIKGMMFRGEENAIGTVLGQRFEYNVHVDVKKIIKQITTANIQIFLDSKKYNI